MTWKPRDALRYSRDAADSRRGRSLWAWVANSYRLKGYGDEVCIAAACRAVTMMLAELEYRRQTFESLPRQRLGPIEAHGTQPVHPKFHANAIARKLRLGHFKKDPHPRGE